MERSLLNRRYINCVTFPRSGHHLLVSCLQEYLGDAFHYCELNGHCRKTPCSDPGTNWQKNHDFHLSLSKSLENIYVVQYRNPIESIVSWYLWELRVGFQAERYGLLMSRLVRKIPWWPDWARRLNPDTQRRWERFLWRKVDFWRTFVHKWIIDGAGSNVYLLPYRRLISDGERELEKLIRFAYPEAAIDKEKLSQIVARRRFVLSTRLYHFQHFEASVLSRAERTLDHEIEWLGLNRIFESR